MSTVLRVLGILSLAGGIIGVIVGVGIAPGAAVSAFASGVVMCVALWWMASMRDATDEANETLDEMADLLRAIAKQAGVAEPKQ